MPQSDDTIRDLLEKCEETMSTRSARHIEALIDALSAHPDDDESWLDARRRIYRALCYVDDDRARDALVAGLAEEEDDVVSPIIEGIWKQQYLLLHRLPELLLANYGTDDGDERLADRLITTLKRHRVTEKIGTDWLADAPEELEEQVTPRPLWM
jgi:hypothetical protein